jgi:hypothetical protein
VQLQVRALRIIVMKIPVLCEVCGGHAQVSIELLATKEGRLCPVHRRGKRLGLSRTPEHTAWMHMLRRCLNPDDAAYAHYGGRGIQVCERWLDFELFLEDMGKRPSRDYSLDRMDNAKGYEPGNCRWATRMQQSNNSRRTKLITYDGTTQSVSRWAVDLGFPACATLNNRLRNGWSVERAFFTPVR